MPNEHEIRAELAEIRAAIIAQQPELNDDNEGWKSPSERSLNSETTVASSTISSCTPSFEPSVSYDDGATTLFRAIESRDWTEANTLISPKAAATWVIRTPEHETLFAWSHWKRLPFHEALRQQAEDLTFLHNLCEAFPSALTARTHHGETALHLACDAGAPLSTICWLTARCPSSCETTDHSGRTPLEVLEDAALLDPTDQIVALTMLEACCEELEDRKDAAEDTLQELREEHEEGLCVVKKSHQKDLEIEAANKEMMLMEVERLQERQKEQNDIWCDRWQAAQDEIMTLKLEMRRQQRELKKSGTLKEESGKRDFLAAKIAYRQREEVRPQLHAAHGHLAEAARTLMTIQDVIQKELASDEAFDVALEPPKNECIAPNEEVEVALLT